MANVSVIPKSNSKFRSKNGYVCGKKSKTKQNIKHTQKKTINHIKTITVPPVFVHIFLGTRCGIFFAEVAVRLTEQEQKEKVQQKNPDVSRSVTFNHCKT